MDTHKLMTDLEYVQAGGVCCPICEGNDVSAGDREADADYIVQDVECENCGGSWKETYRLTGYFDPVDADGEAVVDHTLHNEEPEGYVRTDAFNDLKAQRDELLIALKGVIEYAQNEADSLSDLEDEGDEEAEGEGEAAQTAIERARQAIANATK